MEDYFIGIIIWLWISGGWVMFGVSLQYVRSKPVRNCNVFVLFITSMMIWPFWINLGLLRGFLKK